VQAQDNALLSGENYVFQRLLQKGFGTDLSKVAAAMGVHNDFVEHLARGMQR
jgi:hypothetical protein